MLHAILGCEYQRGRELISFTYINKQAPAASSKRLLNNLSVIKITYR